jgi:hypothetical protein
VNSRALPCAACLWLAFDALLVLSPSCRLGIKSQALDALRALCLAPPSKDQARNNSYFFAVVRDLERVSFAYKCDFLMIFQLSSKKPIIRDFLYRSKSVMECLGVSQK